MRRRLTALARIRLHGMMLSMLSHTVVAAWLFPLWIT